MRVLIEERYPVLNCLLNARVAVYVLGGNIEPFSNAHVLINTPVFREPFERTFNSFQSIGNSFVRQSFIVEAVDREHAAVPASLQRENVLIHEPPNGDHAARGLRLIKPRWICHILSAFQDQRSRTAGN